MIYWLHQKRDERRSFAGFVFKIITSAPISKLPI